MSNPLLIIKPVITEKATMLEKAGKYILLVRMDSTKVEIRNTFKKLYGVDVVKVNALRTAEKFRSGRTRTAVRKKHAFKKVIVTVKGKKSVDLTKPKAK